MSAFSDILRAMFDETDWFLREEWAGFLGVKIEKLNSWLCDEDIPSSYNLNMIYLMLQRISAQKTYQQAIAGELGANGSPPQVETVLKQFELLANKRATEVSPIGSRMLPTVMTYMNRTVFDEVSSQLAKLNPQAQAELLESLYP